MISTPLSQKLVSLVDNMRSVLLLLAVSIAAVAAFPKSSERILGGSTTTITQYPSVASLLFSKSGASYAQNYGGIILNNKAVLTAAHCVDGDIPSQWRIRVGSTYANSGGVVHNIYRIIIHSNYNRITAANNLAIIRSPTNIVFNNNVRAASIAGANYNLADNQIVWAVGWGATEYGGSGSEQLRHVQIWTVNQNVCRNRYAELRRNITDDMLCAGWLDVGGRDQCLGDSGGPLYHNGVVVGVISWGERCGLARYPGVSVRISRHTSWITTNAA